jgi:hypothetical protein
MTDQSGGDPNPYPSHPAAPYPQPGYGYRPPLQMHPFATTSLVLGAIALFTGPLCGVTVILGPMAIVFGVLALRAIKREPHLYGGRGLAIGGVVTGAVVIAMTVAVIAFFAWTFTAYSG